MQQDRRSRDSRYPDELRLNRVGIQNIARSQLAVHQSRYRLLPATDCLHRAPILSASHLRWNQETQLWPQLSSPTAKDFPLTRPVSLQPARLGALPQNCHREELVKKWRSITGPPAVC